jgi:catechol 2,3-dioxygenase-like lactoylglutathione lyase family enzyme
MNAQRNPDMDDVVLAQVALNTADMTATLRLYSELFGFDNAGGGVSWGEIARVQGLQPDAYWMRWWMVGGRPFFQLELFHHGQPRQRPLPEDWRPCDYGWVRFGIAVDNFERVVSGLQRRSIAVLGTAGAQGKRRLAFRDPQVGVIVEIMEGAATSCPAIIYATSSVPDVARARYLYEEVLGAEIRPLEFLHKPEDECMWGLAGAQREGFLVRLADSFLEILSYSSPAGRPQPADHCIVDQGIMNIGLASRNVAAICALIARVQASGLKITIPVVYGDAAGTYVIEPHFYIELMGIPAHLDKTYGFVPIGRFVAPYAPGEFKAGTPAATERADNR